MTDDSAPSDTAAATTAGDFPVTIEHQFGSTTIESRPERVVSVGFAEHEGLLSLGVEPVGVRDWYGDQPYATWPWAQDELGDLQPEVIPADALNFEQIAALDPDLIVGVSSGMTDTDYATLSAIAPTVAQPDDYIEYGTPWDVQLEIDGLATGPRHRGGRRDRRDQGALRGRPRRPPGVGGPVGRRRLHLRHTGRLRQR